MVIFKTKLRVNDNTGAQIAQCVKIYGGIRRRTACLGDKILVCLKKLRHRKKLDKKKLYFGLLVARVKNTRRKDGIFVRYDRNKVLIFSLQDKFLGTRVYGPICKEIRGGKNEVRYKQIISYSGATL